MKILGYSERGILNALLYEIRYAADNDALLNKLMGEAKFPFTDHKPAIDNATVFIEQSFSEFGDSDAVILAKSDAGKCVIFVEAKVSAQKKDWRLSDQLADFKTGLGTCKRMNSSNLFTQIYHKQRFMEMENDMAALKKGVRFPAWSRKEFRKIGTNSVVTNVAECVKQCNQAFYLSLIPDNDAQIHTSFRDIFTDTCFQKIPHWNKSHCGYLTWKTVDTFCEQNQLDDTLAVFKHNNGQIY